MALWESLHTLKEHKWVAFGGELVVSAFLVAYSFGIDSLPKLRTPSFFERDLAFSHPYVEETITTGQLVGLAFVLPLLLILAIDVTNNIFVKRQNWRDVLWGVAYVVLLVGQSHVIAGAIYNTFKVTFGSLRPNAFAYCNYAGYRDALETGNFTEYDAATSFGAFGDMSKCLGSDKEIRSSTTAFPSGHAAASFAGLTLLTFYLRAIFRIPQKQHVTFAALVATLPLMLAAFISITRFRDRYHFTEDILCGALIGIGSALVSWWHYEQLKRDPASKPDEPATPAGAEKVPSATPAAGQLPVRTPGGAPYPSSYGAPYAGRGRVVSGHLGPGPVSPPYSGPPMGAMAPYRYGQSTSPRPGGP